MDLTVYVDLLDDFATFAGAIKDFLTIPVDLLVNLSSTDFEGNFDTTAEVLGSSVEAGAEADADA